MALSKTLIVTQNWNRTWALYFLITPEAATGGVLQKKVFLGLCLRPATLLK